MIAAALRRAARYGAAMIAVCAGGLWVLGAAAPVIGADQDPPRRIAVPDFIEGASRRVARYATEVRGRTGAL